MRTKTELERRLKEIDAQIRDVEARLPAHSVKPTIMNQLFDLEAERDAIMAQLQQMPDQ